MLTKDIIKNPNLSNEEKWLKLQEKIYRYSNDKTYRYLNNSLEIAKIYCSNAKLNKVETEEVIDIINSIKNLKTLCRNCSLEQIIAIIVLRTKRIRRVKERVDITKYKLWYDNSINWKKYSLITDRIGDYYQRRMLIGNKKGY